jgi:hypothetical protein
MKEWKQFAAVAIVLAQGALANELANEDLTLSAYAGTSLVGNNTKINEIAIGTDLQYQVYKQTGIKAGLEFVSRGFDLVLPQFNARGWTDTRFLDLIAGVTSRIGGKHSMLAEGITYTTAAGFFLGVPLGSYGSELGHPGAAGAAAFPGAMFEGQLRMAVSAELALGVRLWTKFGLGNYTTLPGAPTGTDIGASLIASYF